MFLDSNFRFVFVREQFCVVLHITLLRFLVSSKLIIRLRQQKEIYSFANKSPDRKRLKPVTTLYCLVSFFYFIRMFILLKLSFSKGIIILRKWLKITKNTKMLLK